MNSIPIRIAVWFFVVTFLPAPMLKASAPPSDLQNKVKQLAQKLAQAQKKSLGKPTISRVAVLTFDTIGQEAKQKHLGLVVAEALVSNLSEHEGISLIERSQLEQITTKLNLENIGKLDPKAAAELGKFVGASSVIVGTVAEAGAKYMVNARQVSMEKATVITAESIEINRQDLVALSEDMVELKTPITAAFRSAIIPGWGQLYNGDTGLGLTFLGAGALSLVSGGIFGTMHILHRNKYQENTLDTIEFRESANTYATLANIMFSVYGAIWLGNIVHAYATGKNAALVDRPERSGSVDVALMPSHSGHTMMFGLSYAQ